MNWKQTLAILAGILLGVMAFSGFLNENKSRLFGQSEMQSDSIAKRYVSPLQTNITSGTGHVMAVFQANQNFCAVDGKMSNRTEAEFVKDSSYGFSHKIEQEFTARVNAENMNVLRIEYQSSYLEFHPVGANNIAGKVEGKKITAKNIWEGADVELLAGESGIKEWIFLKDAGRTELIYEIISNLVVKENGAGGLIFEDSTGALFASHSPAGMDSEGKEVLIRTTLSFNGGHAYYKLMIDTTGVVYPITVDPSIVFQQGRQSYQGMEDTYLEETVNSDNGGRKFGWLGINGHRFRPLLKFNLDSIPGSSKIESAKLTLWIYNQVNDSIRYRIHLMKNGFYEGTGDVTPPDGDESGWSYRHYNDTTWAKAGADSAGADYYADPVVYDTVSNLSPLDSFEVDVTALVQKIAGHQKIYANHGFLLRETATGGNISLTWISSEHDSTTKRPRLSVLYGPALYNPYNCAITALTDSSFIVSACDSSVSRYGMAVFNTDSFRVGDSIRVPERNDAFICDTVSLAQYSPNFPDTLMWGVYDSLGNIRFSAPFSAYTMAAPPESIRVDVITDSTVRLFLFDDLNPPYTRYSLYDSLHQMYRDTLGETTRVAGWSTAQTWDSMMIPVYIPNSLVVLALQAQNQNLIVTPGIVSDCTWVYSSVPESTIVSVIDSIHLLIRIRPGRNPSYTRYAIQDSISGFFVDSASKRLRSSGVTLDSIWAFGTYGEWGGDTGDTLFVVPGVSYFFRTYSKDGNSNP